MGRMTSTFPLTWYRAPSKAQRPESRVPREHAKLVRRLFFAWARYHGPCKRLASSGPRRALPRLRTVGRVCSVQGFGTGAGPGRGSSEVEHQVFNLGVTGSTPVHRTRSRLKTDCSGTLKTSRPLGPRGTGGRVGRPSSGLERQPWRNGRAGATRTDALKHADSAALRRRQGDAYRTLIVGFRPHGRASRSGPDLSAGSAQAGFRAPKRDRRTIRSPTAFRIQ
jgi:hypothetical protein